MIAIHEGVPYAINGTTRTHYGRYRLVVSGKARPVRDVEGSPLWPVMNLIEKTEGAPGCEMATGRRGVMQEMIDAITDGTCLGE